MQLMAGPRLMELSGIPRESIESEGPSAGEEKERVDLKNSSIHLQILREDSTGTKIIYEV